MANIIAVDFDHTLVDHDTPLPGAKEGMQRLREMGFKLLIFSCNNEDWIEKVLRAHDIPFDWIYGRSEGGKPACFAYIDDRGVGFDGDWDKATAEVSRIEERRRRIFRNVDAQAKART